MYFNRKGSQQTGWRMIKKGKQVVFGCSLLLAVGATTTFATSATVAAAETTATEAATEQVAPATEEATATEAVATEPAATEAVATEPAATEAVATEATATNVAPIAADGQTFSWQVLPTADQLIANAAELQAAGATLSYVDEPAFGKSTATVLVTYADGTTETVVVNVTISSAAQNKTVAAPVAEGTSSRAVAPAEAPTDVQPAAEEIIEADAIASGYINSGTDMTNAAGTISGRAYMAGYAGIGTATSTSSVPEGTIVYLQWKDEDGTVSPIYSTKTYNSISTLGSSQAGPGAYAFDLREGFVDANGVTRNYDANADEYYRVWIEDFTTNAGNRATMQRVTGGLFPGAFADNLSSSQGHSMGEFLLAGANLQRTAIWMFEEPVGDYMTRPREEWIDGTHTDTFLTGDRAIRGTVWYETNSYIGTAPTSTGDPVASGKTVVFSSLTSEGRQAYEQFVANLPELERSAAAKQLLIDNPQYISATVYTTTDDQGNYSLAFPDGTFEKDFVYGMVLDTDGTILNTYSSGFTTPEFRAANANINYRPSPLVNAAIIDAYDNVNFAIAPSNLVNLDITNYDATANPASPGNEAKIDLSGATLSPLPNKLVWTDSQGNVVKEVLDVTSHTDGETRGTFTVPADATPGEIYTVTLYTNDVAIAADSFIVASKQAAEYTPTYAPSTFTEGKGGTVEAPTFTDSTGNTVDAPSGTTYEPGNTVPEGFKVNADGTITVDPSVAVGEYFVPTVVVYPDGSKETVFAQVTINPITVAETVEPVYPTTNVTPGTPATSTPTFTDADGNPTTAPEGTKFEIPSDFTPPTGYKVTIDETTGAVTITAPDDPNGNTAETIEVPVIVTYPDGTKDGVDPNAPVKAVFNLDTDGDGTPDTTDTDDDGDGIPDTEEATDGTNPKDPNSVGSSITPIDDQTGVVGEEITPITVTADKVPTGGSVEVTGLPDGVTYDPTTGQITGTPTTPGTSTVTVTVLDKDGKPVTDKDGNPVTETFTFTVEEKPVDTVGSSITPIDDQTGVVGEEITPITVTADKVPTGGSVEVTGLPDGVTYDPTTGQITGTPTTPGTSTVTVTVLDKDGNPVTDKDGKPVEETFTFTVEDKPVDTDGDGIPDTEDTDDDNDGVSDADEFVVGTDPKNPETTPGKPDGELDTDGDGLTNGEESDETSATPTDKDGNGIPDIVEAKPVDTDGDGIPDTEDTDDDNDGVSDADEFVVGTDPKNPETTPGKP
ncbi:YPDG domain-containing protein, partial [Streptococcus suis]